MYVQFGRFVTNRKLVAISRHLKQNRNQPYIRTLFKLFVSFQPLYVSRYRCLLPESEAYHLHLGDRLLPECNSLPVLQKRLLPKKIAVN